MGCFVFTLNLCVVLCTVSTLQSSGWVRESWLLCFGCLLMPCGCKCSVPVTCDVVGWLAVCDCGISRSYSQIFEVVKKLDAKMIFTVF